MKCLQLLHHSTKHVGPISVMTINVIVKNEACKGKMETT